MVDLAFVPPGEPWKNGYVESFDSRQRDEFLNINTFPTTKARAWLAVAGQVEGLYNRKRMQSTLGYRIPAQALN